MLRLYPPVPFVGRTAVQATTVGGVAVPEGGTLCFSPYALGRDPTLPTRTLTLTLTLALTLTLTLT